MMAEQTTRGEVVGDLIDALSTPNLFRRLVDELEPQPIVTLLKLWGMGHGAYPGDPLPAADLDDLVEWAQRLLNRDRPTL